MISPIRYHVFVSNASSADQYFWANLYQIRRWCNIVRWCDRAMTMMSVKIWTIGAYIVLFSFLCRTIALIDFFAYAPFSGKLCRVVIKKVMLLLCFRTKQAIKLTIFFIIHTEQWSIFPWTPLPLDPPQQIFTIYWMKTILILPMWGAIKKFIDWCDEINTYQAMLSNFVWNIKQQMFY